ncbi:hypothetical protein B0H14DRAFT_3579533 [Mycena olivaceomarginata]|nr:hypothetical protein B0H14DRAFT_3579533 [Mycena olivaceomarginata]
MACFMSSLGFGSARGHDRRGVEDAEQHDLDHGRRRKERSSSPLRAPAPYSVAGIHSHPPLGADQPEQEWKCEGREERESQRGVGVEVGSPGLLTPPPPPPESLLRLGLGLAGFRAIGLGFPSRKGKCTEAGKILGAGDGGPNVEGEGVGGGSLLSPQDQNQNLTAGEKDSGPGAGAGERRGGTTLLGAWRAVVAGGQRARARAGVAVWAVRGWETSERSGTRAIRDTMPCTLQFFFFGVNAFGWAVEGDETEGCANCQISPVETMGGIVDLSSARYERAIRRIRVPIMIPQKLKWEKSITIRWYLNRSAEPLNAVSEL